MNSMENKAKGTNFGAAGAGQTDYNALVNKPTINGELLVGNMNLNVMTDQEKAELALVLSRSVVRIELECTDDQHITLKGKTEALTYEQIKALVDDPKKFVTLRYMDVWWMLPAYDDGGAIMFTSSDIEGGHPVTTRVVINTEGALNNYSVNSEDSDHKTDDLSKEVAPDGHMTYPTTHAVNQEFGTISQTVRIHDRAISPYSKNLPLPLTHNLATGSILAMEGDMVVLKAQEGWGITRIDREEFGGLGLASGDTLLLPMAHFDEQGKPTDNLMLVGAVLFAAEEAVKGQSGEVLYTRRTSLFRATDNAIATWGGVKKWLAIADNESLLICHPLDITSATITRNGNDAANAAADLNQRSRIDEKLTRGARDSRAWVGMCDMFAPSEKTEQAAYRDEVLPAGRILGFAPELGPSGAGTRDGQIADSVSPVMREVSGVTSGSGQMQKNNPDATQFIKDGATVTKDGNIYTVTAVSGSKRIYDNGGRSIDGFKNGDALMLIVKAKAEVDVPFGIHLSATNASVGAGTVVGTGDWSGYGKIHKNADTCYYCMYLRNNNAIEIEKPSILNLTLLPQLPATFVASLGQSDAHRVAHALGFLALQRD